MEISFATCGSFRYNGTGADEGQRRGLFGSFTAAATAAAGQKRGKTPTL